jgi:hypothetical protein
MINRNPSIKGALLTVTTLFGGLLTGLTLGTIVFHVLPGHNVNEPSALHTAISAIPAFVGFLAGGAAWGTAMAGIAGESNNRRMAAAGLLGFAPITITLALALSFVELFITFGLFAQIPIQRLFTFLFVPAAFLIAGTSSFAIGQGLRNKGISIALFWQVGLVSAAAFLVVNITMEALGWVVGAPGAAERATMVTVLFAGNIGAALAGGALLGYRLDRFRIQTQSNT